MKRPCAWSALAAGAAWFASACPGAAAPVYTIEDCIRLGLTNSAVTRSATLDNRVAAAQVTQARAEGLPHVALSSGYRRDDELQSADFGGVAFDLGALDNYEAKASVSQLLYSGGRVRSAMWAAGLARQFADWQLLAAKAGLTRDIRLAFHGVLFARAAVTVRVESVAQFRAQAGDAAAKFKQGTLSEFEMLSARVRLANAVPNLIAASNACDLARMELRRLLNLGDREFDVRGELDCRPIDARLDELQRLALLNRPDLQGMEKLVQLRQADVINVRAGALPRLRAYFDYKGADPYGFSTLENEWQWHWQAGLVAEWDVWDGGFTIGRTREKRAEMDKAVVLLEEGRKMAEIELRSAWLNMQQAWQAVEATQETADLAQRALDIAGVRFNAGLATSLEYADSNLALATARLERLRALREYLDAVARLQYACGGVDRDFYRLATGAAAGAEGM